MHARITQLRVPAERVDDAIASFKDEVIPVAEKVAGFMGAVLLVDRESGAAAGITQWDSEESMRASEKAGEEMRAKAAQSSGGTVTDVSRYENVLMERFGAPRAGTFVRVTRGEAGEGKLDGLIEAVSGEALEAIKGAKGVLALIMGVDRGSRRFVISSVFDTAADREASMGVIKEIRERSFAAAQVKDVETLLFESAVVDMRIPAASS